MAKKYYAVRKGRQTGIFESWDECKRLVTGYKNASFKGFDDLAEAQAFINGTSADALPSAQPEKDTAIAYVDGSYNAKTKVFAYGVVLFFENREITLSNACSDPTLAEMRNVAGEIKGAITAMQFCIDNHIPKLYIYYDYEGIEKWCSGEWKTNKLGTIEYKKYYDSVKPLLDVHFIKVKGHSGNRYNDAADLLAKEAAGIKV